MDSLRRLVRRHSAVRRVIPLRRAIGLLSASDGLFRRCRLHCGSNRGHTSFDCRRCFIFQLPSCLYISTHKLNTESGVRKGLAQRLVLGGLHKVLIVLLSLLDNTHAERLRIAAVHEYLGLENRHLVSDPHCRHTHTPIGMRHTEPEFLVGQIQLHGVAGAPEEFERVKPRHFVQLCGCGDSFIHRFGVVAVGHLHNSPSCVINRGRRAFFCTLRHIFNLRASILFLWLLE